jgi:hypothetical protein
MNTIALRRIEQKLKVKLPREYVEFLERYSELRPLWQGAEKDRPGYYMFMHDADEIIRANLKFRADPDRFVLQGFLDPGLGARSYILIGWAQNNPKNWVTIDLRQKKGFTLHPCIDREPYDLKANFGKALQWVRMWYEDNNWGRPRKKPWKDPIRLSAEEFVRESQPLIRPCLHLTDKKNSRYVAYWRNKTVPCPHGGVYEHLMTIDVRALVNRPKKFRGGCVHLFGDLDTEESKAVFDPVAALPLRGRGKLYAYAVDAHPPVEAVFRFGSSRIQEWLDSNGWERHISPDATCFPDPTPVKAYQKWWSKAQPYYQRKTDVAATVGGWPLRWSDDFEQRAGQTLLFTTYREAEPYREVYWVKSKLDVADRIT